MWIWIVYIWYNPVIISYFGYIYLIQVELPSLDPKSVCPSSTVDACENQKDGFSTHPK